MAFAGNSPEISSGGQRHALRRASGCLLGPTSVSHLSKCEHKSSAGKAVSKFQVSQDMLQAHPCVSVPEDVRESLRRSFPGNAAVGLKGM